MAPFGVFDCVYIEARIDVVLPSVTMCCVRGFSHGAPSPKTVDLKRDPFWNKVELKANDVAPATHPCLELLLCIARRSTPARNLTPAKAPFTWNRNQIHRVHQKNISDLAIKIDEGTVNTATCIGARARGGSDAIGRPAIGKQRGSSSSRFG